MSESIIGQLEKYFDLGADVRYEGVHRNIRALIQPNSPEVKAVADVLHRDPDFIGATQEFVNKFTKYAHEYGDYWATPAETLASQTGDCDCLSILLCSILRNYIPAEKVYCAIGLWVYKNESTGHMWVVVGNGEDRVIESTAPVNSPEQGHYNLYGIFNDKYALATLEGLKEFDLKVINEKKVGITGR